MSDYEKLLEQIESARRFGKEPGVVVTRRVLERLGHPEEGIPYIHVAGTNGKGSSCAFMESLAMDMGLHVGKFTSPHLIHFEERITVDGKEIPREKVEEYAILLLGIDFGVELTMFDYCLAMALLYFKECGCDLMLLETGLGGRLDSTSALATDPLACLITRIGYDHMAILGDTLGAIASEKAGIIRENIPVICALNEPEVVAVIAQAAKKKHAPFIMIKEEEVEAMRTLPRAMIGDYQAQNAAAAIKTMCVAYPNRQISPDALTDARWPGRMELISENPFVLLDGAHNSNGVSALAKSLRILYPGEKFHFVMGVMADKDYLEMIRDMMDLAIDFVTVTVDSDRALAGNELAELITQMGISASFEPDWRAYLLSVLHEDTKEKTICFGSLYFIGAIKELQL